MCGPRGSQALPKSQRGVITAHAPSVCGEVLLMGMSSVGTMENPSFFHGQIHYFDWAIFNSKL